DGAKPARKKAAPRKAQEPASTASQSEPPQPSHSATTEQDGEKTQEEAQKPTRRRKGRDDAFDALLEPFYYGKSLTDPIDTAKDKWNLLPAFLKVKGLVKQHIDSFNFLVEVGLKQIVAANSKVRSDVDKNVWVEYTDIRVLPPNRPHEEGDGPSTITPNECRLRDMTYAAPILVDIRYRRGHQILARKGIKIGRMPLMLRSARCVLNGRNEKDMGFLNECAIDPGGYFVVRGQEKVILVQEQLSKNRVIVEMNKGIIQASVTSSTHERKSKTYVLLKKGRLVLRHNILTEDVPVAIVLKAMGVQSDQEILLLVAGQDNVYQEHFSPNFEDAIREDIQTQQQALAYIGARINIRRQIPGPGRNANHQHMAIEALSSVIITHVPVKDMNFRPKALYIAFMVRRVLMAMSDPSLVDDRDYVGNKRLELAGQMLALLFEDLFKKFNSDFKLRMDKVLKKPVRSDLFDAYDHISMHSNHISSGMERAIATGNWNLKRFKMERAGVTHVLSRLSYISALGMMTRITSQFEKTRK
ncbi:DNA-directed RNA polymerase III subunit, partial [Coniosporium uncinatum]